jgi:hypothetical protein
MSLQIRIIRSLTAAAILLIVSSALGISALAGPVLQVHITNVTNRSFVVSWVSTVPEVGYVKWGRSTYSVTTVAKDQRDTVGTCKPPSTTSTCIKSTVHYVVVSDMKGNYLGNPTYFDVVSGATIDSNATQHYQVRPHSTNLTSPDIAFGQVLSGGMAITTDALVYYTVLDANGVGSTGVSEERSSLLQSTDAGYWSVDLGSLRTPNLQGPFSYSPGDLLNVYALTGKTQSAFQSVDVGSANPKPPMNLADWTATKKVVPKTGILFTLGKWTNVLSQPNAVDKDYWRGVKTSGGVATATFHCNNCSLIRWYTVKSATTGSTQVTIDGNPYSCVNGVLATCNGYNGSKQWQYVWSFFLTAGPHQMTLTGPPVTTKYLILDAFEVW